MANVLKYWWLDLLKGIILILLSFLIFRHPVDAILGLTIYIGFALIMTGLFLVSNSIIVRKTEENWGWRLAEGIIDLIFAIFLLTNTGISDEVLPFVLGFWIVFTGILLFVGSFTNKKKGEKDWWIKLILGLLAVFFGYLIMNNELFGILTITFWIGAACMFIGVANVFRAFNMRKLYKNQKHH